MVRPHAIVTTVPFGAIDRRPLDVLEAAGIDVTINPLGRKLRNEEVSEIVRGYDLYIAGTEIISAETMAQSPNLRAICRVGIGLDGLDLLAARKQGIAVSYTPDGPSPAVAELATGLIIDCLRGTTRADREIRAGGWDRIAGKRVAQCTIGVVGCGRIGVRVVEHLLGGFPGVRVLVHDIRADANIPAHPDVERAGLDDIISTCDAISLHVPLTTETRGLIGKAELSAMKDDCVVINTARGGIVDEAALAWALNKGEIAAAAIDTFIQEPYSGSLSECQNIILTSHLGSMTKDCRLQMEIEAAEDAVRFAAGEPFRSPVPESEYQLAEAMAG